MVCEILRCMGSIFGLETKRSREAKIDNWTWWTYCHRREGLRPMGLYSLDPGIQDEVRRRLNDPVYVEILRQEYEFRFGNDR